IDNLGTVSSADETRILSQLVKQSGNLVDSLQNERAAAVMTLAADDDQQRTAPKAAYADANKAVDDATAKYNEQRIALVDVDATMRDLLERIDGGITSLAAVRSQVTDLKIKISDVAPRYQVLIQQLLDIRDRAAQIAGSGELGDGLRAAASVAKE